MEIEPDSWLSERFGHPLFSLRRFDGDEPRAAETLRAHAEAHPAVSYQAKVPTARTRLLDALVGGGLKVVNTAITLGRDPGELAAGHCEVGEATDADGEALLEVAERSFWATRFHLDPEVPDEVANRIKRDWVDAYLRRERGEQLLVARERGRPIGFLAVIAGDRDGGRVRTIDLTAVDSNHRGAGVGEALARRFLSDSTGACDHVTVGTQAANTGAIRLYERLGFEVEDTVYDLHLHLGEAFK